MVNWTPPHLTVRDLVQIGGAAVTGAVAVGASFMGMFNSHDSKPVAQPTYLSTSQLPASLENVNLKPATDAAGATPNPVGAGTVDLDAASCGLAAGSFIPVIGPGFKAAGVALDREQIGEAAWTIIQKGHADYDLLTGAYYIKPYDDLGKDVVNLGTKGVLLFVKGGSCIKLVLNGMDQANLKVMEAESGVDDSGDPVKDAECGSRRTCARPKHSVLRASTSTVSTPAQTALNSEPQNTSSPSGVASCYGNVGGPVDPASFNDGPPDPATACNTDYTTGHHHSMGHGRSSHSGGHH